jgi:hypothetical protein
MILVAAAAVAMVAISYAIGEGMRTEAAPKHYYSNKAYSVAALTIYHLDCAKLPEDIWVGIKAIRKTARPGLPNGLDIRLAFLDIKEKDYDKVGNTKWCAMTKPLVLKFLAD